jgi:two-component system chemotaxis response regulator CheB
MARRRQVASLVRFDLVVLAGSLGGMSAMAEILAGLPPSFGTPLLFVQHRRHTADDALHRRLLQRWTKLPVRLAAPGADVESGVTLMPTGCLPTVDAALRFRLRPLDAGAARFEPANALFSSAAAAVGAGAIGVVLSGMQYDASDGARAIKSAGGRALAQDPASALARSMPNSAIATGCVDHVLPANRIAAALVSLTMARGAAELFTVPPPPWAQMLPSLAPT